MRFSQLHGFRKFTHKHHKEAANPRPAFRVLYHRLNGPSRSFKFPGFFKA